MPTAADLILKGGTVVNHDGVGLRDVAIRDGRIAGIGSFAASRGGETIDCRGLHILPGVRRTSQPVAAPRSWAASPRSSRCPIPDP